jgi:hypothetical protein
LVVVDAHRGDVIQRGAKGKTRLRATLRRAGKGGV